MKGAGAVVIPDAQREATLPPWVLMSARRPDGEWLFLGDETLGHHQHRCQDVGELPFLYAIDWSHGLWRDPTCIEGCPDMMIPDSGLMWTGNDEAEARRMFREIEAEWIKQGGGPEIEGNGG